MEINKLGYYFSFDRDYFWQFLRQAPTKLKRDFVAFSLSHPARTSTLLLVPREFEAAYFDCSPEAFSWQDSYSDANDQDELMVLMGMLRQAVRHW
eukprot:3789005-Karenia_brevis.AAC.1